jgi:hypothetical protein
LTETTGKAKKIKRQVKTRTERLDCNGSSDETSEQEEQEATKSRLRMKSVQSETRADEKENKLN